MGSVENLQDMQKAGQGNSESDGEKNAPLEGDVETMESHKRRDRKLVEDKIDGICVER
jgi:hypothetical protein